MNKAQKIFAACLIAFMAVLAACGTTENNGSSSSKQPGISELCSEKGVSVYSCGDYIKLAYDLPGKPVEFIKSNGTRLKCPLINPNEMTEECRMLMLGSNCANKNLCKKGEEKKQQANGKLVIGSSDDHGCKETAGYLWCEAKQKCLRPWEEKCPGAMEMNEQLCREANGKWNSCGNKCLIDSQGKDNVACAMLCQELCECGTEKGYGCPENYVCKKPADVENAKGYCVKA